MTSPADTPAPTRLLPRLRAWFGLSQTALGHCLGLSREMVSQAERGVRGLPLGAALPQAALTLAQHATSAGPATEPPDAEKLRRHQRTCQHRAGQLAFELIRLEERALLARRRLAALPILSAALAPAGAASSAWLVGFATEARTELACSGSTAQARLRLRQVGLLAEAAETGRLLAVGG